MSKKQELVEISCTIAAVSLRILSPYEKNHLAKYQVSEKVALTYGEMPVEYITGHVEFLGRDFILTTEALIPRLETEELVAMSVAAAMDLHQLHPSRSLTIADVGTGSGAIGISVYLELAEKNISSNVIMSDVSRTALDVAQQNLHRLIASEHHQDFSIFFSNVLASYPADVKIDLLIANLPYIPTSRLNSLEESVIKFEPVVALDGGNEGLTLIDVLLTQAQRYLMPTGQVLLEVDHTHTLEEIIGGHEYLAGESIFDQFHRQRFMKLFFSRHVVLN
ncbi:MAG: HemK family protein methyltransferase [bacterium]|nr:HemK family protein methyltransferase [bacterium]